MNCMLFNLLYLTCREYGDCIASFSLPSKNCWFISCRFLAGSKFIVAGTSDGKVLVWDLAKRELLHTFAEHRDLVWGLASTFDMIYAASDDGMLSVYSSSLS